MSAEESTTAPTLRRAYQAMTYMQRRIDELERRAVTTEPVAIVGIGCHFPGGARDPGSYWELLRSGRDAVVEVPASRFDAAEFYDPAGGPGKSRTRWGGFIDDIDRFDHSFFGIARREALSMDPQQRVALEVAWHAFEDSGISPAEAAGSAVGVYLGVCSYDYATEGPNNPADITAYSSSGTAHSVVPGRISYVLNLTGPAMSIDTACSSSLVAIHQACQALRARECDLALGGGVNIVLSPLPAISFSQFGMMSRDGRARTFDAAADGCVRGEGCGIVVLKRLSDCERDGDRVLALIRGGAVNQDGRSSGFTAPNGKSQRECIRRALLTADVHPDTVSYVEAHGTGTPLGDPIEVDALSDSYGHTDSPCYLGAVKSSISHLEAAAGVAGLVKVVLSLQQGSITPNLHFASLNPHISFAGTSFVVPTEPMPWPAVEGPRRAAISAFGFSGTNAHLILEQAPGLAPRLAPAASRPLSLLPLSASSATALSALAQRYQDRLRDGSGDALADISAAAGTNRAHLGHRLAVVAADREDAADQLECFNQGWHTDRVWTARAEPDDVVFVFSGHGSQYPGMTAELMTTSPTFRATMHECEDILSPVLDRPLLSVIAAGAGNERIHAIEYAQPALFAVEYSLARLWRSWGIEPAAVMGHSLGEIVAACVAGAYDLSDALLFVAERGRLLSKLPEVGRMAALKVSPEELAERSGDFPQLTLAAVNGPTSLTVSGPETEIDAICSYYASRDVPATKLNIGAAGHSPFVEPMLEPLLIAARRMTARVPQVPVVSNLTGELWSWEKPVAPEYWCDHVRQSVQFAAGVATVHGLGQRTFVEVGPTPRLLGLMTECLAGEEDIQLLPSLRTNQPDWRVLQSTLAQLYVRGARVDWDRFNAEYSTTRVDLPLYPFDRTACPVVVAPRRASTDTPSGYVPLAPRTEDAAPDDELIYGLKWQHAPASPLGRQTVRRWVAVTSDAELGAAFALAVAPDPCVILAAGAPLPQDGDDGPLEVIQLPVPRNGADSVTALAEAQRTEALLLATVATARSAITHAASRLWLVTQGGVVTGEQDAGSSRPEQALLWGLGRSFEQEIAVHWGGLVDLAADTDPIDQLASVVSIVRAPDVETQVAIRNGDQYVSRLEPSTIGAAVRYRPDGAYLLTGGFGGLAQATARFMVNAGARRMILLGRTPLPPRGEWAALDAESAAGIRVAAVRRLEEQGATVEAVCLDIADEAAFGAWLARYEGELRPPILGVVHTAGTGEMLPLSDITLEAVHRALAAKAVGAWVLARAFEERKLDFLVFYSSLGSVLSSPFAAAYAAANAYLDVLAASLRAREVPATSINWGLWPQTGISAEQRTEVLSKSMNTLDPDQALRLAAGAAGGQSAGVVIAAVDWASFGPEYERASGSLVLHSLLGQNGEARPRAVTDGKLPIREELTALPPAERVPFLTSRTVQAVAVILADEDERIPVDRALLELGMDSLMAVELRNQVERRLRVSIPIATFLSGASITDLVTRVCAQIASEVADPAQTEAITRLDRDDVRVAELLAALETDDAVAIAEEGTADA